MRGEHERAEPVSESVFDESPARDLNPVARVELVCARRHLADDLVDREQSRVLLSKRSSTLPVRSLTTSPATGTRSSGLGRLRTRGRRGAGWVDDELGEDDLLGVIAEALGIGQPAGRPSVTVDAHGRPTSCAGPAGVPAPSGALDEMDPLMNSDEGGKVAPGGLATASRSGVSEVVWYPLVVPAAENRVPGNGSGKKKPLQAAA